jgi:hypothetical protein
MRKALASVLFVSSFLLFSLPCVSLAQFVPVYPTDLALHAGPKGNQTTFQVGELIPLTLLFTSSTRGKYELRMAEYDNSGRMWYEQFEVSPSTTKDPLASYFVGREGGFGGLSRQNELVSTVPTLVALQLNEWVRFDTPGRYRVTVESTRVLEPRVRTVGVRSNEFEITIVEARPEWQAATLREALEVMDSSSRFMASEEPARSAAKRLRYLGTPEAAREMARRLRGSEWDGDFMFGLIGSPAAAEGFHEMERLLGDPDFPVTPTFLQALSTLALQLSNNPITTQGRLSSAEHYRKELAGKLEQKRGAALNTSITTVNGPR